MLTLNKPDRHLADGLFHEVVHRQETRIVIAEPHTTAHLRQYSGDLGQVLPGLDIDGRRNDVKRFWGARGDSSQQLRVLE